MNRTSRRLAVAVSVVGTFALLVAACGPSTPSPIRTVPPGATSSLGPSTTATPVATTPAPSPTASSAAVSCELKPQTGTLPSDRLTGMQVLGTPGRDIVRFEFSPGSLTPAGPPVGSLEAAEPPFTEGASGLPIDLQGEHALTVVFRGMSLSNDVGQETFTGEREVRSTDPSRRLRHAVIFDESEGQIGWYLGYDGETCVTLMREGDGVLVVIDYGPSS
jgi:hypothetical protein